MKRRAFITLLGSAAAQLSVRRARPHHFHLQDDCTSFSTLS
jgi:hypothetical protein